MKLPMADRGPIKIVEIVAEEVGTPRGDGSHGSALYRVPLRLSRRPSAEWGSHFVRVWDNPPSFGTMHRAGIASVVGDRIILDGTTVEEIERFHKVTLGLVLDRVNSDVAEHEAKQLAEEVRRVDQVERHRADVEEQARRVKFD